MSTINFIHIPKNGGTSLKKICRGNIKYHAHNVNVFNKNLINQLVVIRNPIDRFISAVYYALEKYGNEGQVRYLINNGINTPDKLLDIWRDKDHPEYNKLMKEMLNVSHKIGGKTPKYKWTYTPQSEWFNEPKYVVLMENLEEEIEYLEKQLGLDLTKLPKTNSTKKKDCEISDINLEFLKEMYKKDFEIYEKYSKLNKEERLPVKI